MCASASQNQHRTIHYHSLTKFSFFLFLFISIWTLTTTHSDYFIVSGLNNILRPNQIKAVLGLHKISEFRSSNALDDNDNTDDDTFENAAYEMGLKQIIVHPEYQCHQPDNDIGKNRLLNHFNWTKIPLIKTFVWLTIAFIWCGTSYDVEQLCLN